MMVFGRALKTNYVKITARNLRQREIRNFSDAAGLLRAAGLISSTADREEDSAMIMLRQISQLVAMDIREHPCRVPVARAKCATEPGGRLRDLRPSRR
jgi:hypothetical protein